MYVEGAEELVPSSSPCPSSSTPPTAFLKASARFSLPGYQATLLGSLSRRFLRCAAGLSTGCLALHEKEYRHMKSFEGAEVLAPLELLPELVDSIGCLLVRICPLLTARVPANPPCPIISQIHAGKYSTCRAWYVQSSDCLLEGICPPLHCQGPCKPQEFPVQYIPYSQAALLSRHPSGRKTQNSPEASVRRISSTR